MVVGTCKSVGSCVTLNYEAATPLYSSRLFDNVKDLMMHLYMPVLDS